MSNRDDAIERLRRGTTPDGSGVAHWEDVAALLATYERRLAIAQEVLEGITQHCMGWVSVIANSALRRMKEIDRDE